MSWQSVAKLIQYHERCPVKWVNAFNQCQSPQDLADQITMAVRNSSPADVTYTRNMMRKMYNEIAPSYASMQRRGMKASDPGLKNLEAAIKLMQTLLKFFDMYDMSLYASRVSRQVELAMMQPQS
jgi:hypothetical protein